MVYVADKLVVCFSSEKNDPGFKGFDPEGDAVFRNFGITGEMIDSFRAELEKSVENVMQMLAER
jgi:hypothetical protein